MTLKTLKKTTAISVSTAIAVVVGLWQFHGWLGKHLDVYVITEVEAADLQREVRAAADTAKAAADSARQTSDRLFRYIEQQELKETRAALERLEGELQDTLLWESQNGENAISRARKDDLERRIADTRERIQCLVTPGRPGC